MSSVAGAGPLPVLWRHRWIMLGCVLLSLAAGAIYIQTVTPIYASTARLYLDYAGLRISNPYEPGGKPQTDKYLYTQAELIKSSPILASALEELTPQHLRTFSKAGVPSAYLKKHMAVEVGKKDETVSITVHSAYPTEAAQIVNRVVAAYLASRSEHEHRSASQVLESLQAAMVSAKEELDKKWNQLLEFQKNSSTALSPGSDQGTALMQQYLLAFQDAYAGAQIKTVKAEEFYGSVQALANDPVALRHYVRMRQEASAYTGEDAERAPLELRAVDLELQKGSSLERVTSDHPKMVELIAEAERVEARLGALDDRFVKAVTTAAEQQYAEAKKHEERYARLFSEQREQKAKLGVEVEEFGRLRLEVNELTAYWQDRVKDVRKITEIMGEEVGQLRMAILEPAVPAERPSEPQKGRTMALAVVLGLLLGGGVAVIRDSLNQTLRSTDEVSALLHLPVLGTVPGMSHRQPAQERGQRVFRQPESHEAEAFRTIRTALFFGAPKDKAKIIMVTSPTAGDGKSTIVSNLGIAMAYAGQKTLILDADFRQPMQHTIFGMDHSERCLNNVFAGKLKLAAAIQPTQVKGLHLLACSHPIANPTEVLSSEQFARLLRRLAEVYDRILVDTPPVVVVTDARIIGALCDVGVLVLEAEKSTRRAAVHARNALQSVGVCLLGTVINGVRKGGDRYGYYYGKYRRYCGSDTSGRNGGRQKDEAGMGARLQKAAS
ncbi:MAG: polysaccharide biosynthesis tyrosine autokinase [Sedimentisphaerales bacterium]|nr:polysaccharide biosynthesis tyrosine autokinase [Sedimentisphaerales bacterium]